jgi:methionyl-tRNA formyltransferase
MRVAVLTTATPHHAYFLHALAQRHEIALVAIETSPLCPSFTTAHPAEAIRDAFEIGEWFGGRVPPMTELGPCVHAPSINDAAVHENMAAQRPDVTIAFGCGKLRQELISLYPEAIWNLHGGDPERYRGLDSHLWACLHHEFAALVTCLHKLRPNLDTGEIIRRRPVPLQAGMPFFKLRHANTELCVELVLEALAASEAGVLTATPQAGKGAYFSFMPAAQKAEAILNFEQYTAQL